MSSETKTPPNAIVAFLRSPLTAGALAATVASLPSTPYNNIVFQSGISSPTFRDMRETAKIIVKREGLFAVNGNGRGLMRCAAPALAGQFFYGAVLFECFETFRRYWLLDEYGVQDRKRNTLSELGMASFGAEFYACFALAPFEVAYAQMVLNRKEFPQKLGSAFRELASKPAEYRFPFGPLKPLWSSGVLKTTMTFCLFEIFSVLFASTLLQKAQQEAAQLMLLGGGNSENTRVRNPFSELPRTTQLNVSFSAGAAAGFCYEVIAHPVNQYREFSQRIRAAFDVKSHAQEVVNEAGLGGGSDPNIRRARPVPRFGEIFSQWCKTEANFRTLWRGFGPKLWMGTFSGGALWFTYDLVTGKNRVPMPSSR